MKKIQANNDKNAYAMVDDDVYETIQKMGLKFCVDKRGYFQLTTEIRLPCMAKKKCLLLHRLVWILKTGEEPSSEVDHQDRNPANNCFSNLRLATKREQSHNQNKRKNNSSEFIGVDHQHKVNNHYKNKTYEYDYWRARIRKSDGKRETKTFPYTDAGKLEAGRWYDSKAREYRGEFAGELNFPDE